MKKTKEAEVKKDDAKKTKKSDEKKAKAKKKLEAKNQKNAADDKLTKADVEKVDDTKPNALARIMINMWNTHFAKTIYTNKDGKRYQVNLIRMFDLSPATRDSNGKMHISEVKEPNLNVTFPSLDGNKIAASIWLNNLPTNKWVIGIHGYNSSRQDVLYLTWHYRRLGYNILTFDFRNHGESGMDVVTWGYKEKWDLIAAINWLRDSYPIDQIGLVGTSMGGFTMNYFMLTEDELIKEANIKWGVSDSAYMSVPKLLKRMISNNAPNALEGYANETLESMIKIYKSEYNVDLEKLDFTKLIKLNQHKPPILYIHNRFDRVTDYLDSFSMWNEKNNIEHVSNNRLRLYDGKHHTKALIEYKKDYIETTIDFVKANQ